MWGVKKTDLSNGRFVLDNVHALRIKNASKVVLTISVLQACCAVTTEYGIPSDFVRKSTRSLQIKISTAQFNFSNRNVIIF